MIESLFSCCLRLKICFILRTGDFPARKDLKNVSYLVYPGSEVSSKEHVYVSISQRLPRGENLLHGFTYSTRKNFLLPKLNLLYVTASKKPSQPAPSDVA